MMKANFGSYYKIFMIVLVGIVFGLLIFFMPSLEQLHQNHLITINDDKDSEESKKLVEQHEIQKELEKIKTTANSEYIHDTLTLNLKNIQSDSTTNINVMSQSNKNLMNTQNQSFTQNISNEKAYLPYRFINTHTIQDTSTSQNQNCISTDKKKQWFTFKYANANIYKGRSEYSKVLLQSKEDDKAQILEVRDDWIAICYVSKNMQISGFIAKKDLIKNHTKKT